MLDGRIALRPVAWVERDLGSRDCDLAVQVKGKTGKVLRAIPAAQNCEGPNCSGVPTTELAQLKLRLYLAATNDQICRAQMGFRLPTGRASATSKYVTLMPNHADWLDWRPGDEDFSSTDSVIPVVAFHKGDSCVASSEVFVAENETATTVVPVQIYESPVVGLAIDPESISKTIYTLQTDLKTNPKDLWVINALGQAYDKHGERLQAINLLSNAVAVNPRASESWLLLAKFQYEKQDYISSIESLEKCLALDPTNLIARAAYADSLAKVHRLDEAGKLFATLLKEDDTRTPPVLTAYGDFLYTEERFAEALEYVVQSDVRHPNCERTLFVKARILLALERLAEATQVAERAVQIDSNFRVARLLLARLYAMQGKTHEAADQEAWLRANLDKNP
jgi:tetratricopeptide (TPR) repeat protein